MAPPFTYEGYRNPYVSSISQLLEAPGQIEAQRAQTAGNAWSQAAQQAGQAASGAIQQATDPRRKLEAMALLEAQQRAAGNKLIDKSLAPYTPSGPQPEGAGPAAAQHPYLDSDGLVDPKKVTELLQANGLAHLAPDLLKGIEAQNDAVTKHQELQHQFAKQQAVTFGAVANTTLKLMDAGMPFAEAAQHGSASLLATGLVKPEQVQAQIQQLAQMPPDQQRTALMQLKAQAARLGPTKTIAKDAKEVDMFGDTIASNVVPEKPTRASIAQAAAQGDATAIAANKLLTPPVPVESAQSVDKLLDGKPATLMFDPKKKQYTDASGKMIENAATRIKPIPNQAAINVQAAALSDTALDEAAQKYLTTGILPPGFGAAGVARTSAVMNRAAQLDPKAALARNQATYKADQANLTKLQTTEGTLSAFENTAGKNLNQFLATAAKIPDTGVPWVNAPLRTVNLNLLGSSDQAAFKAARDVALREIARVTNDPKLSGALTDSARAEVAGLSPADATFAQIKRVAAVLKQDMANVHSGLTEQIATVKAGIGQNPSAPVTAAVPANVAAALKGIAPGVHTLSDGSRWLVAADGSITKQ